MKKANKKLASAIVLGLMLAVPVGASAETINGDIYVSGTQKVYNTDVLNVNTSNNGIMALNEHGKITIDVNKLTVESSGYFSVHVGNNKELSHNDPDYNAETVANVNIEADNIYIKNTRYGDDRLNTGMGVSAYSNGIMNINGNLVIEAHNALDVRGNSTVNINTDGVHSTVINGDIVFETPNSPEDAQNSGKLINSYVNINFNGENSEFNGRAFQCYNGNIDNVELDKDPYHGNVTDFKMQFNNGAAWNMNGNSFVNELTIADGGKVNVQEEVELFNAENVIMNDGIINMQGINQDVNINSLEGTGGTVNIKAEIEDGGSVTSGKLNIGEKAEETAAVNGLFAENNTPKLDVNFTGVTADSFEDADAAKKALSSLADNVSVTGGEQVSATASIKEGIVSGAVSGDMTFANDGSGVGSIEVEDIKVNNSTTTMDNMRDIASVALVAWRQEDSTLSQRLGELRNSEGDQGIWARMSRGEFEYGGAFKNQYNYFQLGYDWAAGDWHYGAAISHNDGQTTYASGSGENDSTSLTLYGTWLGDKGQYTDIVVKQGKLNNEFTNYAEAGTTTGDYDMWGTSISAEYGQKLEMKNDWYVTPQAQLTYMRIGGEDYTANVATKGNDGKVTNAPMYVSQDGMDSFVGRIGFEAGKNISEKGSIYAKASLLHEFAGEADTTLLYGGKTGTYSQDLGDTWYECGFGVNYKTSDNSYVYADVVKTFGGDVETPWQWNAGMRWSF